MIYQELLITFFRIGLFSFGGGYVMIPLIQAEVLSKDWLNTEQIIQIVAISEMTPGPIAVNMATFVGFRTAGVWGSIFATLGVILPSMILVLILSHFFFKFKNSRVMKAIFYGIRPVILGLIISAAVFLGRTSFFKEEPILPVLTETPAKLQTAVNPINIIIMLISLLAVKRYKVHPIKVLLGSGVFGMMLYGLGTLY